MRARPVSTCRLEIFTSSRTTGTETCREALADGNDESFIACGAMYLVAGIG
jgi:hypothetical protein